ncbi:MAG TPA: PPOX class F420-dependent oxidoreductase [Acidimicrobiales bacterium]|nr:PPOX class F420-dependent oxidoreductase [Acidimicrobiales bacterium]
MPYHVMSDEEVRAFLDSTPPHTGKLATVRPDGRPHVVPVWYVRDGEDLVWTTGAESVKARNLRHQPWAALCVDDERPPFSFVTAQGPVTIEEDLDALLHWATVLGTRYMGAEQGEEFGRRNAVPGELVVRLRPASITSAADMAD